MKAPSSLALLLAAALCGPAPAPAAPPQGLEEGMVRIFNFEAEPGGPPGIFKAEAKFGSGTGFVINNQGHIVTNQHVIEAFAPDGSVYWAAHKEGARVVFYLATLVWASSNQDLAVLHCPELRTRTLSLTLFKPAKGSPAHSMGYPGIADADLVGSKGRLFHGFGQLIRQNPAARKIDITTLLGANKTWQNLFEATFTTGIIEKESIITGFDQKKDSKEVAVWDNTLAIRHGNSGGPFLNACGEVIGVVGRGLHKGKNPMDVDSIKWSIQTSELIPALDARKIAYTRVSNPCVLKSGDWKMFYAVGASVLVAGAALVLALLKSKGGRQSAVSYTRVIEQKFKELMGGRRHAPDAPPPARATPSSPTPPPARGEAWILSGRTADGRSIRLEMTGDLFARNGNRLVVGRSRELSHLHLDDSSISRQHAQIRRSGSGFYVADRNSANGTALNGQRITDPHHEIPFRENDTLTFGEVRLVFQKLG